MAILHGSWLPVTAPGNGWFVIWGETWRSQASEQRLLQESRIPLHPLAMAPVELSDSLLTWQQANRVTWPQPLQDLLMAAAQPPSNRKKTQRSGPQPFQKPSQRHTGVGWREAVLAVPTLCQDSTTLPQHSATELPTPEENLSLHPWRIPGLCLSPELAVALLTALPLRADSQEDAYIGEDLRFWSHIARWSLDLLVRSKLLPEVVELPAGGVEAGWQPLLDSAIDLARWQHFMQRLPGVCRFYQPPRSQGNPFCLDLPADPQDLLSSFLRQVINAQVHRATDPALIATVPKELGQESELGEWLQALGVPPVTFSATSMERAIATLKTWTAPLQSSLSFQHNRFRPCFQLNPPTPGDRDWRLEYYLQAVDDPQFLVAAATIWGTAAEYLSYQGRQIERPQETLLRGLGLASRIYPSLESSLEEARPCQHRLTPDQVYEFLKAGSWRLEDSGFGVILPPSLAHRQGWANRLGLKIRAQSPALAKSGKLGLESLLNYKWELAIGGQSLSKAHFDRLVAQNTPLVEINGEWVELRPQDVKAAQAFFAARQQQTGLTLEDALRLSSGDTLTLEKLPVVNFEASGSLEALLSTLTGTQTPEPITEPEGFRGELRPYQARGVGWLAFLERWKLGACLADDMGLGKTIQLIAFLLHLRQQGKLTNPTLLVCPTSVLTNWEREVRRFAPSLKVSIHHGSGRSQGKAFVKTVQGQDLIITSYPLVYRDQKSLMAVNWQGLVLDEAQNIKNPEAKQSRAVRQLQGDFRIALTGTPLENRLTELWSILDFLNPGFLGPRPFFQRRFAIPIERYGDTDSLIKLRTVVQPFILRRLKSDREIIQDLPEKQEMTVFCGLSPEQAALYEQRVQDSLTEIETTEGIQRRGLILGLLVKLKQICNHPAQYLKEPSLTSASRSGKLLRLEEMLEEAISEGDRALVFTQFAEWGKLLQHYLETQMGRETLLLYGGSSKSQREAMVDRFQHDPQGPRIFILSLKAGGVGLNLTRANHVFHFDRWWNPAVENQATDRVFRIGQTRNVQVHKFVCTGTLEERIHEQIESKKALAEQVVGAGETWLANLDTDQLRNLLLLDRTAVIEEES